jgi:rRNA maturation endonuclease Nob1
MSKKEEEFTIKCVKCKTKFPVDFGKMKPGIIHTCPSCGHTFESKSDINQDIDDTIKKHRFKV